MKPVNGSTKERVPLSRDRVLAGAITVADAGGIGALTIRTLAQELGVKPMSVYHYVANKDEIIDGIVDLVYSRDRPAGARRGLADGDAAASELGPPGAGESSLGHPVAAVTPATPAPRRCDTTTPSSPPCAPRASRWN